MCRARRLAGQRREELDVPGTVALCSASSTNARVPPVPRMPASATHASFARSCRSSRASRTSSVEAKCRRSPGCEMPVRRQLAQRDPREPGFHRQLVCRIEDGFACRDPVRIATGCDGIRRIHCDSSPSAIKCYHSVDLWRRLPASRSRLIGKGTLHDRVVTHDHDPRRRRRRRPHLPRLLAARRAACRESPRPDDARREGRPVLPDDDHHRRRRRAVRR